MAGFFSNITTFVNNATGIGAGLSGRGAGNFEEPWFAQNAKKSLYEDTFFPALSIRPDRWNKLYGYRLLVVEVPKNGGPWRVVKNGSSSITVASTEPTRVEQGIEYRVTQIATSDTWEAVLPITPQQLSITDQFAINTTATMRGIVEEHNGVRFKNINIAGTTGIWAARPTRGGSIAPPSLLGAFLGNTLAAFNGVAQGASKIANAAAGKHPNQPSEVMEPEDTGDSEFSTGYYQALYIGQFLERYAQAKKDPANKGWRLVIDMPKRNESFIVTPVTYSSQQSQQKPNEYLFNMQFKAWKRIDLEKNLSAENVFEFDLSSKTDGFTRTLNTIRETRSLLSSSVNLIKAVKSDFRKTFNTLRQLSLVVKDLGGLAFTAADLPNQIVDDFQSTLEDSLANISTAFDRPVSRGGSGAGGSGGSSSETAVSFKSASASIRAGAAVNAIVAQKEANEGLSNEAVAAGALGQDAADSLAVNSLNNVFQNPEENFELFDAIDLDSLALTPEQQQSFEEELERISLITVEDLRVARAEILDLVLQLSNNFGAGNTTYSEIYGQQTPKTRTIPMTIEENEILASLWETIQEYDLLTATKQFDDISIENSLEYVGGLANDAGIDFEDFPSKRLVPVPFGLTLEEISARYMGDADKWIEIATVNKMRSPYIDEDGFDFNFLSNAEGRTFNVDNSSDQLYLNQVITLSSSQVLSFTRKIIDIEEIGQNNHLITVDGTDNLDNLKLADVAKMQGYLPGTVNSQNQIYIPVDQATDVDDRTFEIPSLDNQNLTKLSRIDFLLNDQNDIAINSIGDFRLANGLTNLIQALKLKIITEKGTLLRHLDYGLDISIGTSLADIEGGALIAKLSSMVEEDSRFDGVERLDIKLVGPTVSVDMAVRVANNSGIVPISFNVAL